MFDMSDLKRIEPMGQLAPEAMGGFKGLDQAALAEGAIAKKYKELMTIAVALTTQWPYCIQVHREAAPVASATNVELAESVFVATALRAGAALSHGTHLFP